MSQTRWCDIDDPQTNAIGQTGHSFSDKDMEAQHFTKTAKAKVLTGNSYGTPTYQDREHVTEELDICGYHWRRQNPFLSSDDTKPLQVGTHS